MGLSSLQRVSPFLVCYPIATLHHVLILTKSCQTISFLLSFYTYPKVTQLTLFSFFSDAALAATLSNAANARSKGEVGAASTTPPVSPLSPLQDLAERSKGQGLAASMQSQLHRFFPDSKPIGVSGGALRLRMRCLEKTENLKIVQFAPTLLSAAIFNSVLPAAILNSVQPASILNLVQTAALSNSAVCTPVQKIVSRNFVAAPKTCLEKNLPEPYAVSLNWQCAPLSSDHILEVAA
jgi:hypothetical protein